MESDKRNYCNQHHCPIHACMSNDCQIEYVKESGPHIIREYASKIKSYCPHPDVFYSVQCELKEKRSK